MLLAGAAAGHLGCIGSPLGWRTKILAGVWEGQRSPERLLGDPKKVLEWDTLPSEFLNGPMFIPMVVVDELNLAQPSGELGWLLDGHGGFSNEHEGKVGGRGRPK